MRSRSAPSAILADLNEPQRRAVTHRDGPLLVLAGPGSGKTRVITRRAAHLVHSGVAAHNILAITFTNKAADEMRRRIAELGVARGMWIHTFHALGVRLLREFGPLARVAPGFSIYDEADRLRLIKEAITRADVSERLVRPEAVQAAISRAKNRLETPAEYHERSDFFDARVVAKVYEVYEQLLRQRNAVDFDDLLMRVALLLGDYPELVERLNHRFRYVLIDEYQDTNHAQYLIARHLSRHHGNICATGDPDQSIYGWRGADIGNILRFEKDFPEAVVVRLEQNYRSTGLILQAAAALIAANRRRKRKELWTANDPGQAVRVWRLPDGAAEAERLADALARLRQGGRPYSDFAVFYRVNALSRGLEDALRRRGIPYKIARGVEFYNRKEIRDTLAYLRVVVNPADDTALLRIINTPPRGLGPAAIERLRAAARRRGCPLSEVLRDADEPAALKTAGKKLRDFVAVLDRLADAARGPVADAVSAALRLSGLEHALSKERDEGGEDRLANVRELVTAAARYQEEVEEPTLADFLYRVALVNDQDAVDESAGVVMLMTLHAAKGLEFPVVFIVGLEQGLLPHENALREDGDVEEERRLCFVGMTRARELLTLSYVRERVIRGVPLPRSPSQFLREIDPAAVVTEDDHARVVPWPIHGRPVRGRPVRPRRPGRGGARDRVPVPDDLAPDETADDRPTTRLRRRRGAARDGDDLPVIDVNARPPPPRAPWADWKPGTLVQHARYGVGQVVWIRPDGGQTRAAIRFAGRGEKTFILELAPLKPLKRR